MQLELPSLPVSVVMQVMLVSALELMLVSALDPPAMVQDLPLVLPLQDHF